MRNPYTYVSNSNLHLTHLFLYSNAIITIWLESILIHVRRVVDAFYFALS